MTDSPVTIVSDNDPNTPEDTVITARFDRKKIAKYAGIALAVLGVAAVFGSAMKSAGKNEFIEDVRNATGDETDETVAS